MQEACGGEPPTDSTLDPVVDGVEKGWFALNFGEAVDDLRVLESGGKGPHGRAVENELLLVELYLGEEQIVLDQINPVGRNVKGGLEQLVRKENKRAQRRYLRGSRGRLPPW